MLITLRSRCSTLGQGWSPFAALQWSHVEVLEDSEIMRPWSVCVLLLVPWWMVTGCIYSAKRCWHCWILHLLEKYQNIATLEQMPICSSRLRCGGAAVWVNEGHHRDELSSRQKVGLSKGWYQNCWGGVCPAQCSSTKHLGKTKLGVWAWEASARDIICINFLLHRCILLDLFKTVQIDGQHGTFPVFTDQLTMWGCRVFCAPLGQLQTNITDTNLCLLLSMTWL